MRTAILLCLALTAPAADLLHEPIAVHYNYESHALAGAVVGIAVEEILRKETPLNRIERLVTAAVAALAIGAGKEYLLDIHARPREIPPWGCGAAAAISFRYAF